MHACLHTHIHIYIHVHTYMYIYTYDTYTHTYMYKHVIHTCTYILGLGKRFEYSNLRLFTAHLKLNFSLRSFTATPTSMFAHVHFCNLNVWLKLWVCPRKVEAELLAVSA